MDDNRPLPQPGRLFLLMFDMVGLGLILLLAFLALFVSIKLLKWLWFLA